MISLPYFDQKHAGLLLKEFLATSPSAIVGETAEGRVAVVNERFLALVGWQGDYSGQSVDELMGCWGSRVTHPQVLEAFVNSYRAQQKSGPLVELQPNPGQVIQAQFRIAKGNGGTLFRIWTFHEWRTSALAWVSHEIKNPLNAVLGFSELLADALGSTALPEGVQESLRGLRVGARHLQSVLSDLIDLSRLESGVIEPDPEWTPLGRFLEDLGDLFRTRFRRRGLEFSTHLPEGPPAELLVDHARLSQILSNLLSNSLRFTKRGWVAVKVVRGPHDRWEFAVEDSGVGIPLDQQKTIFEPFVQKQGQDSQKFGGSGLGLAICRTLAQSMGAQLGLTSEPGSGSRFTVTFDHLSSRDASATEVNPPTGTLPGAAILVADDEQSNHLLVRGFLRGTAVTMLSAFDGAQAVEMWKLHHPPVILMDLRMPRLSGVEAARRIRALDPHSDTKLLAMSATKISGLDWTEGRDLWSGFLEKPFGKRDFLKFVANHLTFVDESSMKP